MTILEMHKAFSVIGQSMGLQTNRVLLASEIDVFLNQAISEYVRVLLNSNVSGVIPISISPINALRSLIREITIPTNLTVVEERYIVPIIIDNLSHFISFVININNKNRMARLLTNEDAGYILSDWCNRPDEDYPAVALFSNGGSYYAKIYSGKKHIPQHLTITYLSNPKVVKLGNDSDSSVDCDLPEYLHPSIVELSVKKALESLSNNKIK